MTAPGRRRRGSDPSDASDASDTPDAPGLGGRPVPCRRAEQFVLPGFHELILEIHLWLLLSRPVPTGAFGVAVVLF